VNLKLALELPPRSVGNQVLNFKRVRNYLSSLKSFLPQQLKKFTKIYPWMKNKSKSE